MCMIGLGPFVCWVGPFDIKVWACYYGLGPICELGPMIFMVCVILENSLNFVLTFCGLNIFKLLPVP